MRYEEYVRIVRWRLSRDNSIVGWIREEVDIEVDGFKLSNVFYGHSKYVGFWIKPISIIGIPFIYPYSAAAILIKVDDLTHELIERILNVIRKFVKLKRFKLLNGSEWGIDVTLLSITTHNLKPYLKDYIRDFIDSEIKDQYMEYLGVLESVNKKIGVVVVDLNSRHIYRPLNKISKAAAYLLNPRLKITEKIAWFFSSRRSRYLIQHHT